MILKNKTISIREYGFISTNPHGIYQEYFSAYVTPDTFEEIKTFLLDERNQAYNILSLSRKIGYGEVISAQNYVGVIQTKNGTTIEILPKISNTTDITTTRHIFLKMLRKLKDSPFKNLDNATLKIQKFPILEIFIGLFLDELDRLLRKGIKKNYLLHEENIGYLKGKLSVINNLKNNLTHQERFYCQFDEFSENIRENKLIKTCLIYLNKISQKEINKKRIKRFLFIFDNIEITTTIKEDLKMLQNLNRLNNYYSDTLQWVKIFLLGQSVVNFSGTKLTLALLFPMEKIFENYVARKIVQDYPHLNITTQDSKHYLVEYHNKKPKFNLRPDIVINNNGIIIADTKRKLLDTKDTKNNYGISQMDMYQLFAYIKKYEAKKAYLIYPKTDSFTHRLESFVFTREERISLEVIPFDLENDFYDLEI